MTPSCPLHPRGHVVGLCGRCAAFVCKRDVVEVDETIYCRSCAAAPDLLASPTRSRHKPKKRRGGRPSGQHRWRPFEAAREFVRSLRLRNVTTDWRNWVNGDLPGRPPKPEDIPSSPDRVYQDAGEWTSWGDFLGSGNVGPGLATWRSFSAARAFVRTLDLKNYLEWLAYSRGDLPDRPPRPDDVPATPRVVYKAEWKGWGDFLGNGNLSKRRDYRPFEEARAFARSLGLRTQAEWVRYSRGERVRRAGRIPADVPTCPWVTYRREWRGIGDWLGTGSIAPGDRKFRPFLKARAWARTLGLTSQHEWREFTQGAPNNGRLPIDVPAAPWNVYPQWRDIADWLGYAPRRRRRS